jgi:branched-chain amino acid transport system ATP-binding protein
MLTVSELVVGYHKDLPVLNGIGVTAEAGLVTVILGPNGAGKSTLLRAVYGYLRPRSGEIRLEGKSLLSLSPQEMLRQGVAYLPQGRGIFPAMTVEENLALGGWIFGSNSRALKGAMESIYARYPMLKAKRRTAAGSLSGGEQRALELARLTMTSPRVVLLDEPTVGLMPKLVDEVYAGIVKLKEQAYTILLVDQNIRKAMEIADYVYVFESGRNVEDGPKNRFSARMQELIGSWL